MAIRMIAKNAGRSGMRRSVAIQRTTSRNPFSGTLISSSKWTNQSEEHKNGMGLYANPIRIHFRKEHTESVDFSEEAMDPAEEMEAEKQLMEEEHQVVMPSKLRNAEIQRILWCLELCESETELFFSLNATGLKLLPYELPSIFKHITDPTKALSFYKWARNEKSLTVSSECHELIVKTLCERKQLGTMWNFLGEIARDRASIPDFVFMTIFRGLCKVGSPSEAARAFERMPEYGLKPNEKLYNCLVEALLQCSATKTAEAYIQKMEKAGIIVTDSNLELLAERRVKTELEELYEGIIEERVTVTADICFHTIINLCSMRKLDEAFELFKFMVERRIHPSSEVYEMITGTLAEAERTEEAYQVFRALLRMKDRPTYLTCIYVATTLIMELRMREAYGIIKVLSGSKIRHSIADYIIRLSQATMIKAAWDLLRFMKFSGYQPDRGTYVACLRAAKGQLKKYIYVRDVIRAGGENSMVLPCNLLLKILAKSDHRFVWNFLRFMQSRNVPPNAYSYSRLIKCFYKANKMERGWEAYEEMRKLNMYPYMTAYICLISDAAKTVGAENARELFEEMIDTRGMPDPVRSKYLIVWLCYRGSSDAALKIYRELKARGAVLESSLRIFRCLRRVQTASTRILLAEIEEDIIHRRMVDTGFVV